MHNLVSPAVLLISLCGMARAQVDSSSLTGTVTDQQGKRIPKAKVRATQGTTGLQRETETTSEGNYELVDLPAGTYSVEISMAGFSTFQAKRVEQIVGQARTLNARLDVSGATQQTSITEPLVQLDRVDATVGAAIEQAQISELPINGRDWATLTALVPGAIDNGAGDQRTIRFAGHGLDDNNLTLDGVDATTIYNQEQREYMRLNVPLDSINQFQVQSQNFGADVQGGTAGGQVAAVSPSGTNSFHGDLFDYFRNDALEARTPFNGPSPNPFLLNQFGAGVGGPIVHDKTFFYANYEGLRQRLDGTQIGLVPSPSFLAQASLTSPALMPILERVSSRDIANLESERLELSSARVDRSITKTRGDPPGPTLLQPDHRLPALQFRRSRRNRLQQASSQPRPATTPSTTTGRSSLCTFSHPLW